MHTFPAAPGYVVHTVIRVDDDYRYPMYPIIAWRETEDGLVPLMLGAVWIEREGTALRQAIQTPGGTIADRNGFGFTDLDDFYKVACSELKPRPTLVAAE